MPRKIKASPYPFLDVRTITAHLPEIYDRNVSVVARGDGDKIGFLDVYRYDANGKPSQLLNFKASKNRSWLEKRDAYITRSLAGAMDTPAKDRWWKNGRPTRRHLALIVWAYSPTPRRLSRYRSSSDFY